MFVLLYLLENAYIEGNKSIIQGIIKAVILYVPIEGDKMIYKISEEIPFENDVNIDNLTDECSVFNTVCIEKVEADLNREQIDLVIKLKELQRQFIRNRKLYNKR